MNVRESVLSTIRKCKSSSPYDIADALNINVNRCELGNIHGYYYKVFRIKYINLNCNLSRHDERFVLSHEIGHAVMDPNSNTPFLKASTYLSVDKLEIRANKFALELLIPDEQLLNYNNCSTEQLSRIFGYHEKLIQLRLKK